MISTTAYLSLLSLNIIPNDFSFNSTYICTNIHEKWVNTTNLITYFLADVQFKCCLLKVLNVKLIIDYRSIFLTCIIILIYL